MHGLCAIEISRAEAHQLHVQLQGLDFCLSVCLFPSTSISLKVAEPMHIGAAKERHVLLCPTITGPSQKNIQKRDGVGRAFGRKVKLTERMNREPASPGGSQASPYGFRLEAAENIGEMPLDGFCPPGPVPGWGPQKIGPSEGISQKFF